MKHIDTYNVLEQSLEQSKLKKIPITHKHLLSINILVSSILHWHYVGSQVGIKLLFLPLTIYKETQCSKVNW